MTISATPTRVRTLSGPRLEIEECSGENIRRFSMVLDEQVPKNSPMKKLKKTLKKLLKLEKAPKEMKKSQFLAEEKEDETVSAPIINFNISIIQNDSGNSIVFWEESYEAI